MSNNLVEIRGMGRFKRDGGGEWVRVDDEGREYPVSALLKYKLDVFEAAHSNRTADQGVITADEWAAMQIREKVAEGGQLWNCPMPGDRPCSFAEMIDLNTLTSGTVHTIEVPENHELWIKTVFLSWDATLNALNSAALEVKRNALVEEKLSVLTWQPLRVHWIIPSGTVTFYVTNNYISNRDILLTAECWIKPLPLP